MYRLLDDPITGTPAGVIRLADGACIPPAPGNRDWDEYTAWVADGGEPLPAEPAPDDTDTEQLRSSAKSKLMDRVDLTEPEALLVMGEPRPGTAPAE
jgi:hypothetical protein